MDPKHKSSNKENPHVRQASFGGGIKAKLFGRARRTPKNRRFRSNTDGSSRSTPRSGAKMREPTWAEEERLLTAHRRVTMDGTDLPDPFASADDGGFDPLAAFPVNPVDLSVLVKTWEAMVKTPRAGEQPLKIKPVPPSQTASTPQRPDSMDSPTAAPPPDFSPFSPRFGDKRWRKMSVTSQAAADAADAAQAHAQKQKIAIETKSQPTSRPVSPGLAETDGFAEGPTPGSTVTIQTWDQVQLNRKDTTDSLHGSAQGTPQATPREKLNEVKTDKTREMEIQMEKEEKEEFLNGQAYLYQSFHMNSQKGYYPHMSKENQDRSLTAAPWYDPTLALFCVFDGHGPNGEYVSQFLKDHVSEGLHISYKREARQAEEQNQDAIGRIGRAAMRCFPMLNRRCKTEVETIYSGSTAVCVFLEPDVIWSLNVGDSRAVLGRRVKEDGKERFECIVLTQDHKPSRPDEVARIDSMGGRCGPKVPGTDAPPRVWLAGQELPGLSVTRAFGDSCVEHVGVHSEPEVAKFPRTPTDAFIVVASDGLFEFIEDQTIVDIAGENETPEKAVEALTKEANLAWEEEDEARDDITIIVIFLPGHTYIPPEEEDAMAEGEEDEDAV
eukprot:gb/GEZN01003768.1/.p1 GENE.gb/GEZN01003768.1/~~gb/GEZN01003768.1/.p1  ORF type:complete len:611 (+),score=70.21 gb/GEZN01003768.1/:119-1951(+)